MVVIWDMDPVRIAIVHDWPDALSETFIRAHLQRLPGVVGVFHSLKGFPAVDGRAVRSGRWPRARRRLAAALLRGTRRFDADRAWELALGAVDANVTLAEYGTTGTLVDRACERLDTPLVCPLSRFRRQQNGHPSHVLPTTGVCSIAPLQSSPSPVRWSTSC